MLKKFNYIIEKKLKITNIKYINIALAMLSIFTIYALKLANEKYYIGRTHKDVLIRFQEHIDESGSKWTQLYKPISIIESYNHSCIFEEDNLTKKYMIKYGIENVRGGSYTKIILDEFQIKSLENEFKSVNDFCFNCGKSDHFIKDCKKNNIENYLSLFKTEEDLDTEIIKMTELRQNLLIYKIRIGSLKYLKYTHTSNDYHEKTIILEPSIIYEYKFTNYKYNPNSDSSKRQLIDVLYEQILGRIESLYINNNISLLKENVIENIYKIYIERIKLEKKLKKCLDENSLSLENYMEEINRRIECLYEKYSKIIYNQNEKY